MATKKITIDATGRSMGRVAAEAAVVLRGKDPPAFERNKSPDVRVTIVNASKIKMLPKKLREKKYKSYSGYPGGLKETTMERLVEKAGFKAVFENAVYGMLPSNKLRKDLLKHLTITE